MTLCELANVVSVGSWIYFAWATLLVVGAISLPKGLSFQVSANRIELLDAWRRVQAGNWQSPIYALFLPIVLVFMLPVTFPLLAFGSAAVLLLFGSMTSC